eukprot:CAMPEP_0194298934 /NCGR_PEP_ID=MMETSP0169-20130528/60443_1 /TAXON_ID=218684 /ORGANISM="Corethron pennatum, Strain L29A3" /LENGTH=89 /DNA_ID=CAMNT_0039048981 /DNA_START=1146 /DNA_END=1415 /DNA_ORIENTATION=+
MAKTASSAILFVYAFKASSLDVMRQDCGWAHLRLISVRDESISSPLQPDFILFSSGDVLKVELSWDVKEVLYDDILVFEATSSSSKLDA